MALQTLRVVYGSPTGFACCIAFARNGSAFDPATGKLQLQLQGLPIGPGTLTLTGFPTAFAPAVAGVSSTCVTDPPNVGSACEVARPASPSFIGDPVSVTITSGGDVNAGDITVRAVPFVTGMDPQPGEVRVNPVSIEMAVVDSGSAVDADSIALQLLNEGAAIEAVPLTKSPCDDGGTQPCSAGGALEVRGYRVSYLPPALAPGPTTVRVTAADHTEPPQRMDFSYSFDVIESTPTASPTPTPSNSPTATVTPTNSPTPTETATATSTTTLTATSSPTVTPSATRTVTSTVTFTRTGTPSATPTSTFTSTATATPSATATFSPTPSPTPTRVSRDGLWRGMTSQGQPITLVVADDAVTFVSTGYRLEGESCAANGVIPHGVEPPLPIVEDSVVIEARSHAFNPVILSFRVIASFAATTASGRLRFEYAQTLPLFPCVILESATWTATREPLPPDFLPLGDQATFAQMPPR